MLQWFSNTAVVVHQWCCSGSASSSGASVVQQWWINSVQQWCSGWYISGAAVVQQGSVVVQFCIVYRTALTLNSTIEDLLTTLVLFSQHYWHFFGQHCWFSWQPGFCTSRSTTDGTAESPACATVDSSAAQCWFSYRQPWLYADTTATYHSLADTYTYNPAVSYLYLWLVDNYRHPFWQLYFLWWQPYSTYNPGVLLVTALCTVLMTALLVLCWQLHAYALLTAIPTSLLTAICRHPCWQLCICRHPCWQFCLCALLTGTFACRI